MKEVNTLLVFMSAKFQKIKKVIMLSIIYGKDLILMKPFMDAQMLFSVKDQEEMVERPALELVVKKTNGSMLSILTEILN